VVDEIGICNHGIICLEDYRTPCAKDCKLSITVAEVNLLYLHD